MRVLLVKMSSLGDVVHALPAVSDAATLGIRFDWVVEEAFAAIPAAHPAVEQVIPIAWRRWRRQLAASRTEMAAFLRTLRARRYDLVLDAQGLMKSAAVTRLARGNRSAGFARASAREGAASLFYRSPVAVPRGEHAIDRLRTLFALALGYPRPAGAERFGINRRRPALSARRCLLLHGTTWPSKHWPETMWIALAGMLAEAGWTAELPWGNAGERKRAERIAAAGAARVLGELPLERLLESISGAGLVVGVDSGLTHLAAALGVPTLTLYGSTDASLTGARGERARNLVARFECAPCLSRSCAYLGPDQRWRDEVVVPACYARLTPETVIAEVQRLVAEDAGRP